MRIAYLHQYFNTPDTAGSTRSYEIARRLVRRGHEVHIITTWRGNSEHRGWRSEERDGINIHWLSLRYSNRMRYAARIISFIVFALRSSAKASHVDADLVYATSTPLTIAIPALYCKWRKRIPFVFEVRDLWPEIPIRLNALRNPLLIWLARRLERSAYLNAAHIVALSPDMKRGIQAVVPDASVAVIPNFCYLMRSVQMEKPKFLTELLGDNNAPVVLYAGTLGVVNNIRYMVEIASAAWARGFRICFLVVGDGREEEMVRSLAAGLGVLNKNFFMLPPVTKAQMPCLFAAVHLTTSFVLPEPTLAANSANKFFDSISVGKPVAINHGGWLANVIQESGAGLVLPESDAPRAAEILSVAVNDSQQIARMSAAASTLARERFSADDLVKHLETVLIHCLPYGTNSNRPL